LNFEFVQAGLSDVHKIAATLEVADAETPLGIETLNAAPVNLARRKKTTWPLPSIGAVIAFGPCGTGVWAGCKKQSSPVPMSPVEA